MTTKINQTYEGHVRKTSDFSNGLSALNNTLESISGIKPKTKIDFLKLNQEIKNRLAEIGDLIQFKVVGNELDLVNSRFVHEPISRIEKILTKYTFFPV